MIIYYENIAEFKVIQVSDLLNDHDLMQLSNGIVSDHAVLHLSYKIQIGGEIDDALNSAYNTNRWECDECEQTGQAGGAGGASSAARNTPINNTHTYNNNTSDNNKYNTMPTRYRVKTIPEDIMYSQNIVRECEDLIDELLRHRLEQESLDKLYERYVRTYFSDVSMHFKQLNRTPASKKATRHTSKPYWSDILTELLRQRECLFAQTRRIPDSDR